MYLLHLTYRSGTRETLQFPTAFERGLWIIALNPLPITLRVEDPPAAPVIECALIPQREGATR